MTAWRKPQPQKAKKKLPGVAVLLDQTHTFVMQHKEPLAGFAAWTLFPAIALLIISLFHLSDWYFAIGQMIASTADIILHAWITGCMIFFYFYASQKIPAHVLPHNLDEKDIGSLAWKATPSLLLQFAAIFFLVVIGLYLGIFPGLISMVWFAFASVILLSEDTGVIGAMKASRECVRGRFLPIALRLLGINITITLVFCVLVLSVFWTITALHGQEPFSLLIVDTLTNTVTFPQWAETLFTALFVPFLPYFTISNVILYEALKKG